MDKIWRPKDWKNPYPLSSEATQKGYALMPQDGWHYGFEAGANLMFQAYITSDQFIEDASEYCRGAGWKEPD